MGKNLQFLRKSTVRIFEKPSISQNLSPLKRIPFLAIANERVNFTMLSLDLLCNLQSKTESSLGLALSKQQRNIYYIIGFQKKKFVKDAKTLKCIFCTLHTHAFHSTRFVSLTPLHKGVHGKGLPGENPSTIRSRHQKSFSSFLP